MKTIRQLALLLALSIARPAVSQSVTGQIKEIDAAKGTFTIVGAKGTFHSWQTKPTTEVSLNGNRVTLKELTVGTAVQVSPGQAGFAARIISPPPGKQAKKMAPAQSTVKVPAKANKAAPFVAGHVTAGQTVTITPKKVWWTGGGSKKGKYVDWSGYEPHPEKGIPWMAFVAAVGKSEFWAKGGTLSFTVPADGELLLYAQDADARGNEGTAEVVVETSIAVPR